MAQPVKSLAQSAYEAYEHHRIEAARETPITSGSRGFELVDQTSTGPWDALPYDIKRSWEAVVCAVLSSAPGGCNIFGTGPCEIAWTRTGVRPL
jgi:hypothetical protein